jgi:hypothetical protein
MIKTIAFLFALTGLVVSAFAQSATNPPIVSPFDAPKFVGQTVTVRGVVSADTTSRNRNRFINMGGVYPNQAFTGFIPSKSTNAFSGTPPLDGKTVAITGFVQLYQRQVEIVMDSPSQLKVE